MRDGKGEVVDIKKKAIAMSLLESEKFESAEDKRSKWAGVLTLAA